MKGRNEEKRIGIESNLEDLRELIREGRKTGKINKRKPPTIRINGMLGRLLKEQDPYVPIHIKTVRELYTITEYEMLRKFDGYKKKTWLGLSEILQMQGLPALNLPEEYTSDP